MLYTVHILRKRLHIILRQQVFGHFYFLPPPSTTVRHFKFFEEPSYTVQRGGMPSVFRDYNKVFSADQGSMKRRPVASFFDWGCNQSGVRRAPRRESWGPGTKPLVGGELCPYRCKEGNTK